MSKNNVQGGMPLGTSLLIVVFIILCLVTFATLSFVSSNADNELSISTGRYVNEYYYADALAQEELKKIDDSISSIIHNSINSTTFYNEAKTALSSNYVIKSASDIGLGEGLIIEYQTDINDNQNLVSTIHLKGYSVGKLEYEIISWKTENKEASDNQ